MTGADTAQGVGGALVALADVERALVTGEQLPEVDDPAAVAQAIVGRILGATTPEEVFATFEVTHGKDVLDRALRVDGVRWQRSSFDEGPPIYALLDATDVLSGERMTVTTSGRSVMAALYQLDRLGAWPQGMKLMEAANATPEGYKPLRIQRVQLLESDRAE